MPPFVVGERNGQRTRCRSRVPETAEHHQAPRGIGAQLSQINRFPHEFASVKRETGTLFNLALAAASESDFVKAEELALEAIRIQHSDCYETGLEQIRQQRAQHESASQPRRDIKLSSLELQAR